MFDRLLGFKIHHYLQALGLLILAVGLPLNKVLMSIGTIWLAANLLINAYPSDMGIKIYLQNWKKSIVFWFVLGLFIFNCIGLFYTSDFSYAFSMLNTLLPFFVIPISLIGYPVEKRFLPYIFYGFLLSLLITSGINYAHMLENKEADYRYFSLFGSHIRYALFIVTGILVSIYLWIQKPKLSVLFFFIILWFSFYTFRSLVINGYIAYFAFLLSLFIYFVIQFKNKWYQLLAFASFAIVGGIALLLLGNFLKPNFSQIDLVHLPEKTVDGGTYYNAPEIQWYINGNHVLSQICGSELEEEWERRATLGYNDTLPSESIVNNVLVRYMTSKGLPKDRSGMNQMSEEDIKNVENGIDNIVETYGIMKQNLYRLKNSIFEVYIADDPNGNSLQEHIEHWEIARKLIRKNWIFGVGTGDVQLKFNEEYALSNTKLSKENWNRAHNQFMSIWIAFGVFAFSFFTVFWSWYLWKNIEIKHLLGIGFALIAILSFLTEDTLETQQGVTYIGMFLGIIAVMTSKEEKI